MTLFQRLTSGTLAAAVALTGFAASPARADNGDIARLLAGAATIYIIGKAISKERRRSAEVTRSGPPAHSNASPRAHRNHEYSTPRRDYGRVTPRRDSRHRAATLPRHCADSYRVRGGHAKFYDAHCLRSAGFHRLPSHCAVDVRQRRGAGTAYSERCLTQSGYRVEARRR